MGSFLAPEVYSMDSGILSLLPLRARLRLIRGTSNSYEIRCVNGSLANSSSGVVYAPLKGLSGAELEGSACLNKHSPPGSLHPVTGTQGCHSTLLAFSSKDTPMSAIALSLAGEGTRLTASIARGDRGR